MLPVEIDAKKQEKAMPYLAYIYIYIYIYSSCLTSYSSCLPADQARIEQSSNLSDLDEILPPPYITSALQCTNGIERRGRSGVEWPPYVAREMIRKHMSALLRKHSFPITCLPITLPRARAPPGRAAAAPSGPEYKTRKEQKMPVI